MRILHLGKYFAPFRGGVETYLLDVMNAAPKHGQSCAALVHNHETGWSRRESMETLGGERVPVWRSATWTRALFTPISPRFRRDLVDLIKAFNPDLIHVHLPNPSACWLLTTKAARRIPLVIHWHSDVITSEQGWLMRGAYQIYRQFERALLARAAAIIATSPSYLETSESLADWPGKCHVVPLGLDPARLGTDQDGMGQDGMAQDSKEDDAAGQHRMDREETTPPDPGPLRLLAVGRLTYYKGFGILLRALAKTPGVTCHIVGTGELDDELRTLAGTLQLGDRVRFLGSIDDATLAREIEEAHALCLPSIERTEAFGLVLLEAMAFGRATIASRVEGSGMSWVVEHGKTGLTVPPKDIDALAQALETLRDDPALTQQLGAAGRERFHKAFTIDRSVEALGDVYAAVREESRS